MGRVSLRAMCLAALSLATPVGFAQQTPAAPKAAAQTRAQTRDQTSAQAEGTTRAETLLEHGDYKGAEVQLKLLTAADPGNARLQFDLGFCQEHNDEDEDATRSYTAAAAADPSMPEPKLALGLLQARLGHAEEARPPLQAAANLTSASPQLRGRALRALARLDESRHPQEAVDDLLRATQLTGEQPGDAELSASLAGRTGSPADAEAAYRHALAQDPSDTEAVVGLATLLETQGKLVEADALLRPALAAHPGDLQLSARMAAVDAVEGRSTEAIALLTQLRSADPKAAADPALTRLLAHLDLVSGDAAAAQPLYETLVATDPNNPQLLDDLGSTLVRQQKFAQAQVTLTKAVSLRNAFHDDAAWGDAAGHLAFAASRNGDAKGSLQALALRATVLPNSPASLFLEATAHDTLHQRHQAEVSYRAFLALANGKLPDEEFEARHRLITLEHEH